MSDPGNDKPRRMSRVVKLGLMGAGAAALLYSCAPGIGGGLSALPMLWFFSNPFYRPPVAGPACPPGDPACQQASSGRSGSTNSSSFGGRSGSSTSGATADAPGSTSQRGGFGGSAATHGTTGS